MGFHKTSSPHPSFLHLACCPPPWPSWVQLTCAGAALIYGGGGWHSSLGPPQPPGASGGVCNRVIPLPLVHPTPRVRGASPSLSDWMCLYPLMPQPLNTPILRLLVGVLLDPPRFDSSGGLPCYPSSHPVPPISGASSLWKTRIVRVFVGGRHGEGFGIEPGVCMKGVDKVSQGVGK